MLLRVLPGVSERPYISVLSKLNVSGSCFESHPVCTLKYSTRESAAVQGWHVLIVRRRDTSTSWETRNAMSNNERCVAPRPMSDQFLVPEAEG